jgi:hypothetical protein
MLFLRKFYGIILAIKSRKSDYITNKNGTRLLIDVNKALKVIKMVINTRGN